MQRSFGLSVTGAIAAPLTGLLIGILTAQLAAFCDHVEAMDISPTAVERARLRCEALPNVQILCGSLPETIPNGEIDLVVFSEIGYYFTETQLCSVATELVKQMSPDGIFLAAHWLGSLKIMCWMAIAFTLFWKPFPVSALRSRNDIRVSGSTGGPLNDSDSLARLCIDSGAE